jgi:hypothetical protein
VASNDPGAAALKKQTIMALTAQLLGKKAAVVVQVSVSTKRTTAAMFLLQMDRVRRTAVSMYDKNRSRVG